jgi:transposase
MRRPPMRHVTSIGLDVHARSTTAAALNPFTGEIITKVFGHCAAEIAEWIGSFESPKAVYESGVTGFHLARELRELGVDCVVGAVSKMQKPAADKRRKNDRADAVFLARLLASHNITEVFIPDTESEAARDVTRALADVRDDITRAKQRLSKFLLRRGYIFDELNDRGQRKNNWTRAHWRWIGNIEFSEDADRETLAYYIKCVRQAEIHKAHLEKLIASYAKRPRWKERVDALRLIKGIETVTAFSLTAEASLFSRFDRASEFAAWTGLVPSEHSSGECIRRGGITKSGNAHVRKMLVESSWHFIGASIKPKKLEWDQVVPTRIENHAAAANKRLISWRAELHKKGKKPVVANCASARELACWVWSIGRMSEGSL